MKVAFGREVLADIAERSNVSPSQSGAEEVHDGRARPPLPSVAVEGGGIVDRRHRRAVRLMTSDLRLPVRTRVRTMAMSLLPLTVSGMTWRSCCVWEAERPLGAPGRGLGRSTGSQGLALT